MYKEKEKLEKEVMQMQINIKFKKAHAKPKHYAKYILGNDYDDFIEWGFGVDIDEYYPIQVIDKWNERHSDILLINPNMNIIEIIEKMIYLYKEFANKADK